MSIHRTLNPLPSTMSTELGQGGGHIKRLENSFKNANLDQDVILYNNECVTDFIGSRMYGECLLDSLCVKYSGTSGGRTIYEDGLYTNIIGEFALDEFLKVNQVRSRLLGLSMWRSRKLIWSHTGPCIR